MYSDKDFEQAYSSLNFVERFIVDNYKLFEKGIAIDDIERFEGLKRISIAKILCKECDVNRVRLGVYKGMYNDTKATTEKVRVYKLKPRQEIPDLYEMIDFKNNSSKLVLSDPISVQVYEFYELSC